ncbi:MAG TPA: VOC family protein, partial [Anaerolineales bacterium]
DSGISLIHDWIISLERFRTERFDRLDEVLQEFMALNGGPDHKFTEAISLFVDCKTQAEVDELWEKLSEGGEQGPCGWLKDRFGLSWQIVPSILGELLDDPDPVKSQRVMQAMLQMSKIDIADLKAAYEQA